MRCMFTAPMAALALLPAGSRATEPVQGPGRASLAGRCLPEPKAMADRPGYEVVVDYSDDYYRLQGLLIDFVYIDGRIERRQADTSGSAMAPDRPGARLKQLIFNLDLIAAQLREENPRAAEVGAETLAMDASKRRKFFVQADSFAVLPDPFAEMALILEEGAPVPARTNVRYVRH